MTRILALALVLLSESGACLATVDTSPVWESVTFQATGYRVSIHTDGHYRVNALKLWVYGKRVDVPKDVYRQIENPDLSKVEITEFTSAPTNRPSQKVGATTTPRERCRSGYLQIPVSSGSPESRGNWIIHFNCGKYSRVESPAGTKHEF